MEEMWKSPPVRAEARSLWFTFQPQRPKSEIKAPRLRLLGGQGFSPELLLELISPPPSPQHSIPPNHFINQCHQYARSAGTNWMPNRYRAAIHIGFIRIKAKFPHHTQCLH